MDRTNIVVGPGLAESATETLATEQGIDALGAVSIADPVRRAVFVDPGDALTGADRDLGGRECKILDRHFLACRRDIGRDALDDDLAWRSAHGNRLRLGGRQVDDGHVVRTFPADVSGFAVG